MTQHNRPATSAAEYAERTHDQNKARELHPADTGAIDLEAFQLMSRDGQRRVWALASDADRRGLALQIIRSRNIGPDAKTLVLYLELCDQKFGSAQVMPSTADILEMVNERIGMAELRGNGREAARYDRVVKNLESGARLSWCIGDLLVQSVNNPGQVYSVNERGCTCPNGAAGRSQCWHVALFDLLTEMADDRAAAADILADASDARAEIELDVEPPLRPADEDEPGWYVRGDDGRNHWMTDAPARRQLAARLCAARSRVAA